MLRSYAVLGFAALLLASSPVRAQPSYWLFESGPARPLALSGDHARLYALNTPDGYLEVYDATATPPVHLASVPVGLEPVAVALRNDTEAWVVNHLSDSVSVVDLAATPPRVIRTLLVGDEPMDVVFGGAANARAFVTSAHRGQNTPDPRGGYATPGLGRADVWVFDAANPGDALTAAPITVLSLFSDRPRALAVSPDGNTVYAAAYFSGNRTTALSQGLLCNPGVTSGCTLPAGTSPAGLPPPIRNHQNANAPPVGLIVQYDPASGEWRDERGVDYASLIRFSLPDEDVFTIDASANPPVVTGNRVRVGTVLFAMAVNPATGKLYVANTDANNRVRFEGPGDFVRTNNLKPAGEPASVRGHLHEARITVIDGATVTPHRLNAHLDYAQVPQPASARERSLAQPMGMAITADGNTLFLAAFGSQTLARIPVSALESGSFLPDAASNIALSEGGPTGVVLDETHGRAYVATRFDNGISVVSLTTNAEVAHMRMHDPEPAHVIYGRPVLYDARLSSSTGEAACGSCHVFGDMDHLAWDLGNPDGDVLQNPNPIGPIGNGSPFHPMKGPMTTQTFRGMSTHGPMHWRGDRTGAATGGDAMDERAAFMAFLPAFGDLLGRDEGPITSAEMERFTDFVLAINNPPNPMRALDSTLAADEARGHNIYFNRQAVDTVTTCNGCHALDRTVGHFGTNGTTTFESETQEFKVAQLRNAYEKVGMFGMPATAFFSGSSGDTSTLGPQVRGFGFLHDGSTDTTFRFLHAAVFPGLTDGDRRDLESFVMAYESELAPIVGQQVSLDAGSEAAELARLDLLDARAGTAFVLPGNVPTTECDLVAQGVVSGLARGYRRTAAGTYESDRVSEAARTLAEMKALAAEAGNQLTFTCAPPGSGRRIALDRDEDGVRNRDELDANTDPADRPFPADPSMLVDAGPSTGRLRGGPCGCSVEGSADRHTDDVVVGLVVGLLAALFVRRRARRRLAPASGFSTLASAMPAAAFARSIRTCRRFATTSSTSSSCRTTARSRS